jgi:pimeloyl-ACP methyl ester carboxylesterase
MSGNDEDLSHYPVDVELEHFWYENDGLKLHAVAAGQGPLVVLLHGFPEFWYCWRYQLASLARQYRLLVPDLRSFNLSQGPDSPAGYALPGVAGDIIRLVKESGEQQATIIGHDWGGYVGWHTAHAWPEGVRGLITLSVAHPAGMIKALSDCPEQQAASDYVSYLAADDVASGISVDEILASMKLDKADHSLYRKAIAQNGLDSPLGFYRMLAASRHSNYFKIDDVIECPVLALQGVSDPYVRECAYRDNASFTSGDYHYETIGSAGHFILRDQPEIITQRLLRQLQDWH